MQIVICREEQPELKTATEIERWSHFQQKHTMIITMTAMEKQNLEQEMKDVLSEGLQNKDTQSAFFYAQTRMTLYELYQAISGGKTL